MGALLLNHTLEGVAKHVASTALRFGEPFDGRTADIERLSCIDQCISDADIIVLGELNHFIHEKSDFRLFFCRYLLSRGFRTFAEELGWSDGVRVDRYLNAGDEGELRRLPSFGHERHKREDRDDRPTGLLKYAFDSYPTDLFMAEQTRFYRGLRTAACEAKLDYFGFDIDGSPGGSYEDIAHALARCSADASPDMFRTALARAPGETVREEADRLRKAREALWRSGTLSKEQWLFLHASLGALIDSLDYVAATYASRTYEELRPGMALREDAMKRRLANIEQLSGSDKKLVLMGHALHLVRDDARLAARTAGVGPGGGRTTSLGHHLAQEKAKRVFAVWLLYGAGEDSQPFPELPRRAAFSKDTLNTVLAEFGTALFFLTNDPAFWEPVCIGHMYNAVVEAPLGVHADAVFFLPTVTPLRA